MDKSKLALPKLKMQVEITGLDELHAIVDEMIELASRLSKVEIKIKTSLPKN